MCNESAVSGESEIDWSSWLQRLEDTVQTRISMLVLHAHEHRGCEGDCDHPSWREFEIAGIQSVALRSDIIRLILADSTNHIPQLRLVASSYGSAAQ